MWVERVKEGTRESHEGAREGAATIQALLNRRDGKRCGL
jgi:hypothetical protein